MDITEISSGSQSLVSVQADLAESSAAKKVVSFSQTHRSFPPSSNLRQNIQPSWNKPTIILRDVMDIFVTHDCSYILQISFPAFS